MIKFSEDPTIKVEPIDGGPYPFPSLNPPGITFSDVIISIWISILIQYEFQLLQFGF